MMNDNILLKLKEMRSGFTPVEGMIADCILENPAEALRMSIKELAIKSNTSDASVLRFSKALGYTSYRNFIVSLSTSLAIPDNKEDGQYTDIRPGDDLYTIINNVMYNDNQAITDTAKILDRDMVKEAVDLLCKARKIDFYGVGASGIVCLDAEQKFVRINKICRAHIDSHSQLTAATLLTNEDVAVILSYSGTTLDVLDALNIAKNAGAKVIAITKCSKSPLSEQADVVLNISTPEITIRSGAMGSRIAMLAVIDVLFSAVASSSYQDVKQYLMKTHDIIAEKRKIKSR